MAAPSGTQSIEKALAILQYVGQAGEKGARLADLVQRSAMPQPTVRRLLLALIRAALIEQNLGTRRYFLGVESYILGALAQQRFGFNCEARDACARLARATQDTVFASIRRDGLAVCIHRDEGSYPIRTHALRAGDRHPLGVGAGSLAILASLPDAEVEAIIEANRALVDDHYPHYQGGTMLRLVEETRRQGYAFNPGMVAANSWGVGVAVPGADGQPQGALSLSAIDARLDLRRRVQVARLLQEEADKIVAAMRSAAPVTPELRRQTLPAR